MLHGLLTGKFETPEEVPDGRARTRHFSSTRSKTRHGETGEEKETFRTISRIDSICREYGVDMTQASLAWPLSQSGVDTVIAGGRSPEYVEENAKAGELKLPDALIDELEEATKPLKERLRSNPDMWQGSGNGRIN